MALPLLVAFACAACATGLATPVVIRLAIRSGWVVKPGGRHVHDRTTPTSGGLGMLFGFGVSLGLCRLLFPTAFDGFKHNELIALAVGGVMICALGGVDDRYRLRAKLKLIWQILAAAALAGGGVLVVLISNPLHSGAMLVVPKLLAVPLTIAWIVAVTNAINLIDGLDGLAAGVSAIACAALSLIAAQHASFDPSATPALQLQATVALLAAALSGAAAGFLPWNFNPARIFMGDFGAYFLGFVMGALTVLGAFKMAASIAIFVPLLVLIVPLFDTTLSTWRRYRSGQPLFRADRYHLHHQLLDAGLSQRQIVALMYAVTFICSAVALWVARRP